MKKLKSLLGSRRSRIFREPRKKGGSFSFKRKQRVKFRTRYAGSLAKQAGKWVGNATLAAAILGACAWAAVSGQKVWGKTEAFRIKSVVFSGDIPAELKKAIPLRSDDNLLLVRPAQLEKEALARFPELKEITIRRNLNKIVTVDGKFRVPVAKAHLRSKEMGIDADGVLFPLAKITVAPEDAIPWIETDNAQDRKSRLADLATWKKTVPDFYSLVKKIETDRMHAVTIELSDGVIIKWGDPKEVDVEQATKRILKLRRMFEPAKTPALLTLVTAERIAMDSNWKKAETK